MVSIPFDFSLQELQPQLRMLLAASCSGPAEAGSSSDSISAVVRAVSTAQLERQSCRQAAPPLLFNLPALAPQRLVRAGWSLVSSRVRLRQAGCSVLRI